jgi:hypothetical protein
MAYLRDILANPLQGKALIKQSSIEISILSYFLTGQELFFFRYSSQLTAFENLRV